ncbi:MAG TPA: L,D-transpeptidase family protein [Thermodesulfovibrionales bacterium]|nr:L,D-transpeptidase family protein [Thermodesulfovibrionales bacterium]
MIRTVFIAALLLSLFAAYSRDAAGSYFFDRNTTVIGSLVTYETKHGDSLIEIARKFGLGYNEIMEANPSLDPFVPGEDVVVTIPSSWVLPDVESYDGIVINLAELRLYYFFHRDGRSEVNTYPIGIGSEGKDTPLGRFSIMQKEANPSWHVPESIRKERPELPMVVPPGPENPLGSHALRLSLGDVLIHGTNRPWGVGRRVSHGCIRLYPEDIPRLYGLVSVGAKVTIVRQPVKIGVRNNKVFLEVHNDGSGMNYLNEAVRILTKKGLLKRVCSEKLYDAVEEMKGAPVEISE